ncbi:MAG TPA: hypothetical protein V6C81_08590 [Planktothrix sp.]|jgi:hypothetical protein
MFFDSYLGCAVIVIAFALVAALGQLAVRKTVTHERLKKSHEVGGYLLSVVGTLYAVLLGLVVVDSMNTFQKARDITEQEANALADIWILSSRFPAAQSQPIQTMCSRYADVVVTKEWDAMRHHVGSLEARQLTVGITKSVIALEPVTPNQQAIFPQMISDADSLWQSRRTRMSTAIHGVPAIEWLTLIIGAVITVFFTYFFGLDNVKLQLTMTCMVAVLIALNLVLVLLFGYPFAGDLAIRPTAFELDQAIFTGHIDTIPIKVE